jgi:DDE superfamily endonuclease
MELHLKEIAQAVAPGAHAAVLLDRAGWHVSTKLAVPANITLVPLPPRSPELNPVENVWQFLRENWLSNREFASYEDILDHCCAAWILSELRNASVQCGTAAPASDVRLRRRTRRPQHCCTPGNDLDQPGSGMGMHRSRHPGARGPAATGRLTGIRARRLRRTA